MGMTRRDVLITGTVGSAAFAAGFLLPPGAHAAEDDAFAFVEQLIGRLAVESDRLHLAMPADFPTGYTVPLDISVDSPMSEADHVRYIRVFAPKNPIVEIVRFNFTPGRGLARVSTRVRLAQAQFVVAVAEMSNNTILKAKTWVDVATNGCA